MFPVNARVVILALLIRFIALFLPSYKKIAHKNLLLAYPQSSRSFRSEIIKKSYKSLARLIVDFLRLPQLDENWVMEHVDCTYLNRLNEIKKANPGQGVLIVSGHLGSFELSAHAMAMFGYPLSIVVRDLKLPRLDRFGRYLRECSGNRAISRDGAWKELIRDLAKGSVIALMFDQNVRRAHAVFVNFFGRLAATTKTLGIAAVRARAPIFVVGMIYLGNDRYRLQSIECDFSELYHDDTVSNEDKVLHITAEVTKHYEKMILQYPEGWFWMHRRWKTTPPGSEEDFYG